jgi:hypothetical protein
MVSYLKAGGLLRFKAHCHDVGHLHRNAAAEQVKSRFAPTGRDDRTDSGTCELCAMNRL